MPTFNHIQLDAMNHVYQAIASDIPPEYSPEEIAELIIDASRLTIHGFPEIDKQVSEIVKSKGYNEVLRIIARELYL